MKDKVIAKPPLCAETYVRYFCATVWAGWRSRYSDWLRSGRSGDRIPVRARFSTPVQTGPGAHPASCTMGTGSFLGVKSGRGVTLTPQRLLVPWSGKSRAIPLLTLWAVRPVQSLSAFTRVHFTSARRCNWPFLYQMKETKRYVKYVSAASENS